MATSIVKLIKTRREAGQSATSSFTQSVGERLKEKFDPRKMFNQKGLLVSLFPGLKAYKAKLGEGAPLQETQQSLETQNKFKNVNNDLIITAKNMMTFPMMHRDMNIMRQNIVKLVKLEGGDAATKADAFFLSSKERSLKYKAEIDSKKKSKEKEKGPERIEQEKDNKFLTILGLSVAVAAIGTAVTVGFKNLSDEIRESLNSSLGNLTSTLTDGLKNMFDWTKMSANEIMDMGSIVIDYFKKNSQEIWQSLFSSEMKTKLLSMADTVLSTATGSGEAFAMMPPPQSYLQEGGGREDFGRTTGNVSNIQAPSYSPTRFQTTEEQSANQKMVYDAFINAGFSKNQSLALTAEVGRENGYQKQYLFGTHIDPHNKALNVGMFSWQGTRAPQLLKYLQERGLADSNGKIQQTQAALNAQAEFTKKEMEGGSYSETKNKFLSNENIGKDEAARILGTDFIKWRYGDPKYAKHHAYRDEYYRQIMETIKKSSQMATDSPAPQKTSPEKVSSITPNILPQQIALNQQSPMFVGDVSDSNRKINANIVDSASVVIVRNDAESTYGNINTVINNTNVVNTRMDQTAPTKIVSIDAFKVLMNYSVA